MYDQTAMDPAHYSGLRPQKFSSGHGVNAYYEGETGVLLDDTDFIRYDSRAYVEAHFPNDFRGGGPDPRVDTRTVTVRKIT